MPPGLQSAGAHHEREYVKVDEEGKHEHADGSANMVQKRPLHLWIEEQLVQAPEIHCML